MAKGASTFAAGGEQYERFMGRYSMPLAGRFADFAGVSSGDKVVDIGCGTGALTVELVRRTGAENVAGCDPSPMLDYCRERCPGVELAPGAGEHLPFADARFDIALAQLVFHFLTDPAAGVAEMRRTVRPGGRVAAAVWDAEGGMRLLGEFWRAAQDADAQAGAETLRFGGAGELTELFEGGGLEQVREERIEVSTTYRDFDELWGTLLLGVGPVGAYVVAQDNERRTAIRSALFERLGAPNGQFALGAVARVVVGTVPG